MIKIKRTECPACLSKPDDQFRPDDYKKGEVKEALLSMQYGKCCFCERSLRDMGKTERWAEHFMPKSSFKNAGGNIQWHLANKWENLLFSCATCNGAKATKYPVCRTTGIRTIINPSCGDIDPEEHIGFVIDGWIMDYMTKANSPLGRSTIEKLNFFSRHDLIREFRKIKPEVDVFFAELLNAIEAEDKLTIEQMKNELERFMSAHLPFAAFKRALIYKYITDINKVDIPKLRDKHSKSFESISVNFLKGCEIKY